MEEHERGREAFASDEEFRLHRLRHSTSHVMAEAVTALFPTARLAIGPAIKDGFYYDMDVGRALTEEDLPLIEAEMKRIVKRNSPFVREDWPMEQGLEWFGEHGQTFKVELIQGFGDDTVSVYDQGGFKDLCRGPHVGRTGNCKHFKLLKISGAYWRGDAKGPQLQRIYGTVWPTRDALDLYLHRLEEAKKRDHRKLIKELDLVMFHDYAPGVPFFLPRGEIIWHELSEAMRSRLLSDGYVAVRTPQLFDKKLWDTSGHWAHYKDAMFHFEENVEEEGDPAACAHTMSLKPMNCPSHMLIFGSKKRSYRDLPMRIHDQGVLHRNELRGALSGMTRVRQFCQDDAHLFVMESQIEEEVNKLIELVKRVYGAFDMGFKVELSTRPEDRLGTDDLWDQAEGALKGALASAGVDYTIHEGDGAFYGPKIDFGLVDALDRVWQCATIQLDYQIPRRFDLTYVGEDNAEHIPVVIHRAIFGSLERFFAILIEHYAGQLPMWLAPEQVRVMSVSEKSEQHARAVTDALVAAGIRASCDDRSAKIGYKIRECHELRVPCMAIVGEREAGEGTVSIRRGNDPARDGVLVADFVQELLLEARRPF